jgi:hypothetical protein
MGKWIHDGPRSEEWLKKRFEYAFLTCRSDLLQLTLRCITTPRRLACDALHNTMQTTVDELAWFDMDQMHGACILKNLALRKNLRFLKV